MTCPDLVDDQRRLQIWAKDFWWTDAGREHCQLTDKHHIGDLRVCVRVCLSVYVWACFVGISTALPMFSYLWGKFMYFFFLSCLDFVFFFFTAKDLWQHVFSFSKFLKCMCVCIWKLTLSLYEWFFFKKEIVLIYYWCLGTDALAPEWM